MNWPEELVAFGLTWKISWNDAATALYENKQVKATLRTYNHGSFFCARLGGEDSDTDMEEALRDLESTLIRVTEDNHLWQMQLRRQRRAESDRRLEELGRERTARGGDGDD